MPPPEPTLVAVSPTSMPGLTAKPLPKELSHIGFVVHYQDADAH
jgi:hypothetical protein